MIATRRRFWTTLAVLAAFGLAGCSDGIERGYGRSRGESINGTGAVAQMLRDRGHQVRAAVRLTDELSQWADVIVRFAPHPGPIEREEAEWYGEWLDTSPGRRLLYVARDYDAGPDYWKAALESLDQNQDAATPRKRERVQEALSKSQGWEDRLGPKPKEVADPGEWFATREPPKGKASAPQVCSRLGGPWASGVEAEAARLVRHEVLKAESEEVMLSGDGDPLVMSWTRERGSRVLVAANGSFLLNAAIAAWPGRRPLAARFVAWAGHDGAEPEDEAGNFVAKRVAFVEGSYVVGDPSGPPSVFDLLTVDPFGKVAAQLFALGLVACLARAPRLGRPRADDPSGADRPVAHAEALGALLARAQQARECRAILETYQRWRGGPGARPPSPPG